MRDRREDLAARLAALRDVARQAGVDRLVLRDPATLAWLLEARVHVPQTLESACLDAVVDVVGDAPTLTVVTNAIEAPRLHDTELAALPVEWEVVPWWQSREARLPSLFKNTPTQMFNGYADQVASLYSGMDLRRNY